MGVLDDTLASLTQRDTARDTTRKENSKKAAEKNSQGLGRVVDIVGAFFGAPNIWSQLETVPVVGQVLGKLDGARSTEDIKTDLSNVIKSYVTASIPGVSQVVDYVGDLKSMLSPLNVAEGLVNRPSAFLDEFMGTLKGTTLGDSAKMANDMNSFFNPGDAPMSRTSSTALDEVFKLLKEVRRE